MPVWLEVIIAWVIVGTILNIIFYNSKYMRWVRNIRNSHGYLEGLKDASVNIRLYYEVTGELPSDEWVVSSKGEVLETREQLVKHDPKDLSEHKIRSIT